MPLLALLAAALLLLSTQGTSARWTDAADMALPAGSRITSGALTIARTAESVTVSSRYPGDTRFVGRTPCTAVPTGYRSCVVLSRAALAETGWMRGDRIEIAGTYTVAAKGDNLRYRIAASSVKDLPPVWKQDLSVSPTGVTSGPRTVTARRVLTFDGDAAATSWPDVLTSVSLDPFTVTVVQTNR